jgi:hypothetical protein
MTDDGQQSRETWARKAAHHIVDGVLAAIERYPAPDQMALLREVARRALWHMPNSSDEVRDLARHLYFENLHQPYTRDDDPPNEPPWS